MIRDPDSKPHYTEFRLPGSKAVVQVQSTLKPPEPAKKGGFGEASGADKARETWEDGLALVREMAGGVVTQLQQATAQAESVTVEFGVNISSKVGVVLVEGQAQANLKVTMTWKGQP